LQLGLNAVSVAAAVREGYTREVDSPPTRMPPPGPSLFAERVRLVRNRLGMNQTELAKQLGCSQAQVSDYETAKSVCSIVELTVLCNLSNVSADWLIGRSDFEHGLAPDQWIADEDAIAALRANPKAKGIVAFKVPRRMRLLDLEEFEQLKRELRLR
jgi:transcriptional regulator with XRE-family HTH domain